MAPSNQHTEAHSQQSLFAEGQGGGMGFTGFIRIVVCLVLVFGGFYLMGSAFGDTEYSIELFLGGLFLDVIGFAAAFMKLSSK